MIPYANLHTHSSHSDGGYSPAQVVRTAKQEGYKAIAITDHETITGFQEMKETCEQEGMEYLFGVEFYAPSALLDQKGGAGEFHIVGYEFDPEYPAMKRYLQEMSLRETEQTKALFDRGVALGKLRGITWEEVLEFNKGMTWICNEQLFMAMKHKGLIKDEQREWYFAEFFGAHRFGIPSSYKVKQEQEIIRLIRDAGGIAVVAHPHNQMEHLDALMEMGIQGLEIWHPLMTEEERMSGLQLAYENGLYISGGSDHFGLCSGYYDRYKPLEDWVGYTPPLSFGTTKEYFEEIKNRKLNR